MSIDEEKNQPESDNRTIYVANTIVFNRRVRLVVLHPFLIANVACIVETYPTDSDHDGPGKTPKRMEVVSVCNGSTRIGMLYISYSQVRHQHIIRRGRFEK